MFEFFTNPAARRILGAIVRRALDALGGYLVAEGLATQADATELATALAPILVSLAWSLWQKRQQGKREAVALNLPAGSPPEAIASSIRMGLDQ